jgi:hypothetical protein
MPKASIFAFARSCGLDPDGSYFVTRMRPLNGNVRRYRRRNRCHERRVDGAHGGVPHIERERDRLSDASM